MSTRTRIILQSPAGVIYGPMAKAHVLENAKPPFLPLDWARMPTWRRINYLAKYLPRPMKCVMIREPRGTKASRSLYWKTLQKLGVNIPRRLRRRPKAAADHYAQVLADVQQRLRRRHIR